MGNETEGGLVGTVTSLPKFVKPAVGDKFMASINEYGSFYICQENQQVFIDGEYYEIEVKAIKKAKVSFE